MRKTNGELQKGASARLTEIIYYCTNCEGTEYLPAIMQYANFLHAVIAAELCGKELDKIVTTNVRSHFEAWISGVLAQDWDKQAGGKRGVVEGVRKLNWSITTKQNWGEN